MPPAFAIALCEDDLRRDQGFLEAFAGAGTNLRVIPLRGGTLSDRSVRLLDREAESAARSGLTVSAVVIHNDADRSLAQRRQRIRTVYSRSLLAARSCPLIACVPDPCIERWLCLATLRRACGASPGAGCDPWKRSWERGVGLDVDRVRTAARLARERLTGLDDFQKFLADWMQAGLT